MMDLDQNIPDTKVRPWRHLVLWQLHDLRAEHGHDLQKAAKMVGKQQQTKQAPIMALSSPMGSRAFGHGTFLNLIDRLLQIFNGVSCKPQIACWQTAVRKNNSETWLVTRTVAARRLFLTQMSRSDLQVAPDRQPSKAREKQNTRNTIPRDMHKNNSTMFRSPKMATWHWNALNIFFVVSNASTDNILDGVMSF